MVRHEGGIFERAAELAEHGDSGGAEGVIADARGDARSRRALAHQLEGIDPVQHIARQFAVASDRAKRLWCNQGRPMVMLDSPKGRSLPWTS